jgi:hypothetical protein
MSKLFLRTLSAAAFFLVVALVAYGSYRRAYEARHRIIIETPRQTCHDSCFCQR